MAAYHAIDLGKESPGSGATPSTVMAMAGMATLAITCLSFGHRFSALWTTSSMLPSTSAAQLARPQTSQPISSSMKWMFRPSAMQRVSRSIETEKLAVKPLPLAKPLEEHRIQSGSTLLLPIAALSGALVGFSWAMASSAGTIDPQQFIKKNIGEHDVVIFSKTYCPFCTRAKGLFAEVAKGYDVAVVELDQRPDGDAIQQALLQMTGQRTVPNVFVKGHHVGGNDDSQAAARSGKLQALLEGERKQIAMMSVSGAKSPSPSEFIQQSVAGHDVAIFSKTYCPFCARTKSLFAEVAKGYDVAVVELDQRPDGDAIQQALLQMTGQRTVPNVFVKGHHVGGNDDSQAAARSGKLQALLEGERKQIAMMSVSGAKSSPDDFIKQNVAGHDAVIFSKTYCPFCTRTKSLFAEVAKGYDVAVVELDQRPDGDAIQQALLQMTGQRTVPNVFVKGHHVGGNDDSQAAARSGKLQALLEGERKQIAMMSVSGERSGY